jgi:hypothetical protein
MNSGQFASKAHAPDGGSVLTVGARFWEVSSRTVLPLGLKLTLYQSSLGSLSS